MNTRISALLAVVVAMVVATTSVAQEQIDAHAARVATDVSHSILSPFCPGKTLAMCPSPAAAEVRMSIQTMAESGMEADEIKEAVITKHGEEFRIVEPPRSDDIGLLGALGVGLLLAVVIVAVISRRRAAATVDREAPAPSNPVSDDSDPYLAELRKQVDD